MKAFHRLHALRMENDAAGYAMEEMRPRFDSLNARHEAGTAPRAVSAFNLFQTPVAVAERLAGLLGLKGGERILEPSAGLGRLLDAVKLYSPAEVVAMEISPACCAELFHQNRADVTLKQRDFLTVAPGDLGLFDAIIMNPPFHMRADIRHIMHARQFLKPGGKIAAICFNQPNRAELKRISSQWIEIESGAFKESGTRVETAICIIDRVTLDKAQEIVQDL